MDLPKPPYFKEGTVMVTDGIKANFSQYDDDFVPFALPFVTVKALRCLPFKV